MYRRDRPRTASPPPAPAGGGTIGLTFPLPALFALMSAAHSAEPGVQAPEASRHVVFSHGQESGPWGRKISALADVARSEGYLAHSVDYRGIDEPRARVARLADFCKELTGDLVLVGWSLGGFAVGSLASPWLALRVFPLP